MSPQSDVDESTSDSLDTDTPHVAFERTYDYSAGQAGLVRGVCQEVSHTKSRRSGPRRWRRAVEWLIAAGLHPRANATTLRVAEDLADRMDYTSGHVRYCMIDIAARLGVDKATVKRHVAYLRELGALAWVQHGSLANVRPLRDLPGYAATATVYAAVIPASYDQAMGYRIVGTGYGARIVIDQRGQAKTPVDTAGNKPVDNSGSERLAPPSRTGVKEVGQVDLVGGFNYTSQARPPKTRIPHQTSLINGRRRTAADVKNAGNETRLVRALVNWTQSVPLRQLEFVLRPWTDRGWDGLRIADELNGMCAGLRWRPKNPVAFIRARIAADTAREQLLAAQAAAVPAMANREWAEWIALKNLLQEQTTVQRTQDDRDYAQAYGWDQWRQVADHYDEDPDDALDLYGEDLCKYAVGRSAREQEAHDRA